MLVSAQILNFHWSNSRVYELKKPKYASSSRTIEKSFKTTVTTTGSTRSKLLHFTDKRVKNIPLMATEQVSKKNKK